MDIKYYEEREYNKKAKELEKVFDICLNENDIQIMRLDGKAFKTFCKEFEKPFDNILRDSMEQTLVYLCSKMQGCILGYTQSDEITIMFANNEEEKKKVLYNGRLQKLDSVFASMCTLKFNECFIQNVEKYYQDNIISKEQYIIYQKKYYKALFDCRTFSVSNENAYDMIKWRILDCYKNTIQMIARTYYTHEQLKGKSLYQLIILIEKKKIKLENYSNRNLYGICCMKDDEKYKLKDVFQIKELKTIFV